MKLSERDAESLKRRVGGSSDDGVLTLNCVTAFCQSLRTNAADRQRLSAPINYDVVTPYNENDVLFAVRFTQGVAMMSHASIDVVMRQSPTRVLAVNSDRDGNVLIVMLRSTATDAQAAAERTVHQRFVEPQRRKRRHVACDYAAADITSSDDQATIDGVVDAVYHMRERMPVAMNFWFEKVRVGSAGAERGGNVLPLTRGLAIGGGDDDDESESIVGGAVAGYSLCFTDVGSVDGAFLRHLHAAYPSIVVSSYAWIEPPHSVADDVVLVVNVRASTTVAASDAHQRVVTSLPRGTKRVKRVAVRAQ